MAKSLRQRSWLYLAAGVLLVLLFVANASSKAAPLSQSSGSAHYGLSCGTVSLNNISAIENLSSQNKVVTQINGETQLKTPGELNWGDVTLRRPVDNSVSIWDWRKQVVTGQVDAARKSCSIYLFDKDGATVAQWDLERVWPSGLRWETLQKADGTSVEQEVLVLTTEGLSRVAVTIASDSYLPVVMK